MGLDFNSTILQEFLECRSSACSFVCYSSFVEPFLEPFEHLSVNSIYEYFYHDPQPLDTNYFFANVLSALDNVLYKIVIGCILSIVTQGLAML